MSDCNRPAISDKVSSKLEEDATSKADSEKQKWLTFKELVNYVYASLPDTISSPSPEQLKVLGMTDTVHASKPSQ